MNLINQKVWFALLLLLPSFLFTSVCCAQNSNNEYEVLMQRIRANVINNPKVEKHFTTYNEQTGAFSDVDYTRRDRTNWDPIRHVERLSDLAFAYTHPQNNYFQDDKLYDMIVKGLEYWYEVNPHCNNWWYNQIAEPQKLGILLIQMRTGKKTIPAELETKTLQRMIKEGGNPAKWTGANRSDIALHWIYRSCLEQNEKDLLFALENAYSPLTYTVKEGFQHDNSYFQHGVQLYIGGYGDAILSGITELGIYTHGTRFALNNEQIDLISRFIRNTYYPTIRGQYMLFGVLGRGVSRPNNTHKAGAAIGYATHMITLDPYHADEYRNVIERLSGKQPASYGLKPRHTHFFRGDYTNHTQPAFTFDVRTVSDRTMRLEYGNGENLDTYFMSDGCTNIVTKGDEYYNIFPVWNWNKIPGVTAPNMDSIPKAKSDWQTRGTSTFTGGVSDSISGASTYAYYDGYSGINTGAKKSWFFFNNAVVCLGADIHSSSNKQVETTINQCLLKDEPITLLHNKKETVADKGETAIASPQWVHHNQIGYYFPEGGDVVVNNQSQRGTWYNINRTAPNDEIVEDVFTLSLDHDINPNNAKYAYIVVPNIASAHEMKKLAPKNIEILANQSNLQAVRDKKEGIWQFIFHAPGTFRHKELTVTVDKACALQIKDIKDKGVMHIADPGQKQTTINVEVTLPKQSKSAKTYSCNFEGTEVYAGATKSYLL